MKKLLPIVSLLMLSCGRGAAEDRTFWISPCDDPETGCKAGDLDLGRWALQAWEASSDGKLHFIEAKKQSDALIQMVWASPTGGLYGETVPINVNGRRGSRIYIVNTTQNVKDSLLRDTIVYLTCLHESGHALGLQHTDQFADIMYFFGFGGDIDEYFGRYRRKLTTRDDIRKNSGISPADHAHLLERLTIF